MKYQITRNQYGSEFINNKGDFCLRGRIIETKTFDVDENFFRDYYRREIWKCKNGIFDDNTNGIKMKDLIDFYIESEKENKADVTVISHKKLKKISELANR